jgi:hypothetical protein
MSAIEKTRLVYLLAASHSGSTLLASLLSSHPQICTAGELKMTSLGDVSQYRCSCRALIEHCPFWQAVSAGMLKRGFTFSVGNAGTHLGDGASPYIERLLRPLHRGRLLEMLRDVALFISPTWRNQIPMFHQRNAALSASICECSGKPVIVDSSKIALRLKYLLRNPALSVKVIRLVRDGRGVALTYTDPAAFADAKDPHLRGGGMGGDRHNERLSFADAAWEWRRSTEEADAVINTLSREQWTEIHYEDLCTRTEETLTLLYRFLEVTPVYSSIPMLGPEEKHIIGNGMRFDTAVKVHLDDRWKSNLTANELRIFDDIAGPLSRRLGYA